MSKSGNPRPGQSRRFEVFCGVDVTRENHRAVGLGRDGRRLVDRALANDGTALRALFSDLAEHGRLLVVVDQPASIGALASAVARSMHIRDHARRRPSVATASRPNISKGCLVTTIQRVSPHVHVRYEPYDVDRVSAVLGGRSLTLPAAFSRPHRTDRHLGHRQELGISAKAIREDRILDEAIATAGDARRISDLFGLSVTQATRYTNVLDPPATTDFEHARRARR